MMQLNRRGPTRMAIKMAIVARHRTVTDVAEAVGLSQSELSQIIWGHRKSVPIRLRNALSRELQESVEFLFADEKV